MRVSIDLIKTAWVPEGCPQDEAVSLGVSWIKEESIKRGAKPLVVANTRQNVRGVSEFESLEVATPRSSGGYLRRPVLAFLPTGETLAIAQQYAQRSALCVIEGSLAPVVEWAIEIGSKNLRNPSEVPSSSLSPELKEQLNAIELYGGGNGWAGAHEKEDARRRLDGFRGTALLDPDAIAAYMVGRGLSDTAYKNIREIVIKLNR